MKMPLRQSYKYARTNHARVRPVVCQIFKFRNTGHPVLRLLRLFVGFIQIQHLYNLPGGC